MERYYFSPIKKNCELDQIITQLRLRRLPLTLEVINSIRNAIEKPKLDEEFHKVVEREFSIQWKEIQRKHHLDGWGKNLILFQSNLNTGKQKTKAKSNGVSIKEIQPQNTTKKEQKRQKEGICKTEKTKGTWSKWNFPVKLEIPSVIETIQQVEILLNALKKHPKSITYNLTHDIASRIQVEKVFNYYKDELKKIRQEMELAEEKKRNKWRRPLIGSGVITDRVPIIIEKASETSNLYDNFEYGLSDWDK